MDQKRTSKMPVVKLNRHCPILCLCCRHKPWTFSWEELNFWFARWNWSRTQTQQWRCCQKCCIKNERPSLSTSDGKIWTRPSLPPMVGQSPQIGYRVWNLGWRAIQNWNHGNTSKPLVSHRGKFSITNTRSRCDRTIAKQWRSIVASKKAFICQSRRSIEMVKEGIALFRHRFQIIASAPSSVWSCVKTFCRFWAIWKSNRKGCRSSRYDIPCLLVCAVLPIRVVSKWSSCMSLLCHQSSRWSAIFELWLSNWNELNGI